MNPVDVLFNPLVDVAFIVGATGVSGPILLSLVTGGQRRRERREDFARQDARDLRQRQAAEEVARQARDTAARLLAKQDEQLAGTQAVAAQAEEAAKLLVTNTQLVADTSAGTQRQLSQIHTLVNSQLSDAEGRELSAQQRELEATEVMLATMREVVDLKRKQNVEPTMDTIQTIRAVETRIRETRDRVTELSRNLDHKLETTAEAQKQFEASQDSAT